MQPYRIRLAEVYRRLKAASVVADAEETLRQLCQTLESVEDEMSGVPRQDPPPPLSQRDGRMYCPLEDQIRRNPDGSIEAFTRRQIIQITATGSLRIINRASREVEFER